MSGLADDPQKQVVMHIQPQNYQFDKFLLASLSEASRGFSSLSRGLCRSSAQLPTTEVSFFQAELGDISEPAELLAQSDLEGVTASPQPPGPWSPELQPRASSFLTGFRLGLPFGFSQVPKEASSLLSLVDQAAEPEPSLVDHVLSPPSFVDH